MKKFLFLAAMLLAALSATAQNTRIAILETVDREGKVPYGVKLMLRTNLTHAISSTEGFEGYDQVDLASLFGVRDFSSAGLITDDQVRQLGEKTGAAYLLIAEVAQYDTNQIIITAKILNTETAVIEVTAPPKVTASDPESLQQASAELMGSMLVSDEPAVPPLSNAWRTLLAKVLTNVTQRMDDGSVHIGETEVPSYILQQYSDGTLYCGDLAKKPDYPNYGMLILSDGYEMDGYPGAWAYCGGFLGGEKSGTGLLFDASGRLLYYGKFEKDKPLGEYPQSTVTEDDWSFTVTQFDNGDFYVGQELKGAFMGYGLYLWTSGDAWFGMWEDGKMEGEGIYMSYDGSYTNGYWKDGEFTITLDESFKRYLFSKRFAAVMSHAPVQYTDGSSHFGDTLNGLCVHSFGKNEHVYLGEYVDGFRDGDGGLYVVLNDDHIVNLPKSWAYVGNFKMGLPNDTLGCVYGITGKVIYAGPVQAGIPSGNYPGDYPTLAHLSLSVLELEGDAMYLGETLNGLFSGIGIYIWPDDDAWFGYWDQGRREGPGLQMNNDGSCLYGIWQNGEFVMTMSDYIKQQKEAIPWTDRLLAVTANAPQKFDDGGVHFGSQDGLCLHSWGNNNSDGLFCGYWKDGNMGEMGLYIIMDSNSTIANCPDGWIYMGEFKDGIPHGKNGMVFDMTGRALYAGKFRKGKPTGRYPSRDAADIEASFGILNDDGDKYIGTTMDGNANGFGLYIWESGNAWFGWWEDGVPDKGIEGIYLSTDGKYFIGKWDDVMQ